MDVAPGAIFPASAIRGGHDVDGSVIYVGQGFHQGDWLPAKVIANKRAVYVPYGGKEVLVPTFKVILLEKENTLLYIRLFIGVSFTPAA